MPSALPSLGAENINIIIDTFLDIFSNTLVYPYQTLVMGNASYYNGGRGIHVFRSSNVTVANNTVFNNNTDTCLASAAYVLGELSIEFPRVSVS